MHIKQPLKTSKNRRFIVNAVGNVIEFFQFEGFLQHISYEECWQALSDTETTLYWTQICK